MSAIMNFLKYVLPVRESKFRQETERLHEDLSELNSLLYQGVKERKVQAERLLLAEKLSSTRNERRIIHIGVPTHSNIGDAAIACGMRRFLSDCAMGYNYVSVEYDKYFDFFPVLMEYVHPQDLLLLQGGGNFGNQYLIEEQIRRSVIASFPKNRIILFPQTFYFTDDEAGRGELQQSCLIYNAHRDLHLFARENTSFELMKTHFPKCFVEMVPDMFLYQGRFAESVRENALCCFRKDAEKASGDDVVAEIRSFLEKQGRVTDTDTIAGHPLAVAEQVLAVEAKLQEFRCARIVVTDRLHGMIFSTVTGTPCVVLGNYNHKVCSFYDTWLKDRCDYILFAKNCAEAVECIEKLMKSEIPTSVPDFSQDYVRLADLLKQPM